MNLNLSPEQIALLLRMPTDQIVYPNRGRVWLVGGGYIGRATDLYVLRNAGLVTRSVLSPNPGSGFQLSERGAAYAEQIRESIDDIFAEPETTP